MHRFRRLLDAARADAVRTDAGTADPGTAAELLQEAIALWRGEALLDVPSEELHRTLVPTLQAQRLDATELRIELALRQGHHTDLLGELAELTAHHPTRESLWAKRMLALSRAGRRGDALEVFHDLRAHLVAELGVEPGAEILQLQGRILRAEEATTSSTAPSTPPEIAAQMPMPVPGLVGRTAELATADRLLDRAENGTGPAVVAVTGPAGVGKTAFAVRWAHQARDRFPGGLYYLNLHGYDQQQPTDPPDALAALLRAVGRHEQTAAVEELAARWRGATEDRRALLVLDNAAGADQVRPLLPGRGCFTVVTSRSQLRGLAARDGATRLAVTTLGVEDALLLLADDVGAARAAAEPAVARRLVAACGGLPLALRIVGERAGRLPEATLAELLADLTAEQNTVDALSEDTDPTVNLTAVLSCSRRSLTPDGDDAFRLLGLFPGHDLGLPAAAALLGGSTRVARRHLDQLVAVHLLEQRRPDRFEFHDLVRDYAAAQADRNVPPDRRREALTRLLDWYLSVGAAAQRNMEPTVRTDIVTDPAVDVITDYAQAVDWLETETDTMIRLARAAYDHGLDEQCWQLAWVMFRFLSRHRRVSTGVSLYRLAADAADRGGNGRAVTITTLSAAWFELSAGRIDDAIRRYDRAIRLAERIGDTEAAATAHDMVGICHMRTDRLDLAVRHHQLAISIYRSTGNPKVADAIANLGVCRAEMGDLDQALDLTREALRAFQGAGRTSNAALTLGNLADIHERRGDYDEAEKYALESIAAHGTTRTHSYSCDVLLTYGRILRTTGRPAQARRYWLEAEQVLRAAGDPRAELIPPLLASLAAGDTAAASR